MSTLVYQSQLAQGTQADAANPQTSVASEPKGVSWKLLWGQEGFLLGLQSLWQHFMHDTQVVSAFVATHATSFCEHLVRLFYCLSPLHFDCTCNPDVSSRFRLVQGP